MHRAQTRQITNVSSQTVALMKSSGKEAELRRVSINRDDKTEIYNKKVQQSFMDQIIENFEVESQETRTEYGRAAVMALTNRLTFAQNSHIADKVYGRTEDKKCSLRYVYTEQEMFTFLVTGNEVLSPVIIEKICRKFTEFR